MAAQQEAAGAYAGAEADEQSGHGPYPIEILQVCSVPTELDFSRCKVFLSKATTCHFRSRELLLLKSRNYETEECIPLMPLRMLPRRNCWLSRA